MTQSAKPPVPRKPPQRAGRLPKTEIAARHARFILLYCQDLNATQAAIGAGFSPKTAYSIGHELLKKPEIWASIQKKLADQLNKLEISEDSIVQELGKIAFQDHRKFYKDGKLKPMEELDDNCAAALSGVDIETLYQNFAKGQAEPKGTIAKVRTRDSVRALEVLARVKKMLNDRPVTVNVFERVPDADISERIASIERELGYAREIDEAGRIGLAQARAGAAAGTAKN